MIIDVPPEMPVSKPLTGFMVAMRVLLLLHVPPVALSSSGVVVPVHVAVVPVMTDGSGYMVISNSLEQPSFIV